MREPHGNVYLLNGCSQSGKTVIGSRLYEFIKTERKNWRFSTFWIDESNYNGSITNIPGIISYVSGAGCDMVISHNKVSFEEMRDVINPKYLIKIYLDPGRARRCKGFYDDRGIEDDVLQIDTSKSSVTVAYNQLLIRLKSL